MIGLWESSDGILGNVFGLFIDYFFLIEMND